MRWLVKVLHIGLHLCVQCWVGIIWIQHTLSHNGVLTNVIVLVLRSTNGGSASRLVTTYSEN
jgi:hypothetical protein